MSTLYMIRHGQASADKPDYDQLSTHGERQARRLGAYLADAGLRFDRVYKGPLKRHIQTCNGVEAVFHERGLPWPEPAPLDGLDEYPLHHVMMAVVPKLAQRDPAYAELAKASVSGGTDGARAFMQLIRDMGQRWMLGQLPASDIESWESFRARVANTLTTIAEQGQRGESVLAFSSAGTVAAMVGTLLGATDDATLQLSWTVHNASITRLRYSPTRGCSLMTFNETPHFGDDLDWLTFR